MKKILIFSLLFLATTLVACERPMTSSSDGIATMTPTRTEEIPPSKVPDLSPIVDTPTPTEEATIVPVFALTSTPVFSTPVATATSSAQEEQSFSELWTPVAFKPVANGTALDWDEHRLIPGWIILDGMVPGTKVLYLQSGVGNSHTLTDFIIPSNEELIFGAVSARVVLNDKNGYETIHNYSNGFYAAVPPGMTVVSLTITDGFAILSIVPQAQDEFCARIAQTYVEHWANAHLFPDPVWDDPVCTGTYAVPIDSDRVHGGILPLLTATPTK